MTEKSYSRADNGGFRKRRYVRVESHGKRGKVWRTRNGGYKIKSDGETKKVHLLYNGTAIVESYTSVSRRYMDGTLLESFLLDGGILYGKGVVPDKIVWWAGVKKIEPPRRVPDGVLEEGEDLSRNQELLFIELAQAGKELLN